jgi:hypothetical protein
MKGRPEDRSTAVPCVNQRAQHVEEVSAHRWRLRSGIHACAGRLRRLLWQGHPRAESRSTARSGRRPCSALWQWIGLRGLEARGASRGNAGPVPVERRVFPQLALRASQQRRVLSTCAPRTSVNGSVIDSQRPPLQGCTPRPLAAPRAAPQRGSSTLRRTAASRRGAEATAAWRAAARPAGRTLAATTPAQACGGHGWRSLSRRPSLRACFGLREARLEGEPSQVEAHLGCASGLPSLRGPWMAPQA